MFITMIILGVVAFISITLIIKFKSNVCSINKNLNIIKTTDTNMLLKSTTSDKDIRDLVTSVNEVLENYREIAIQNERTNRDFKQAITNISHDLRTPLTSVMGYIQMIKSDKTPLDKKDEYLKIIEERTKYLSSLMNNLFEYTKILEGNTLTTLEKVNICNTLRDTVSAHYQAFNDKNYIVNLTIPDEPVYCVCDSKALERIICNLIQNALVHGIDFFELIVDPKTCSVVFKNKVANIGEIDITRLFDRFYTADLSRSEKSTGLGLAITKELMTSIGGEIAAYADNDVLSICMKLKQSR